MSSPPSSSEPKVSVQDYAAAYARLHLKIQQWIWDQGWQQLRAIQARAIDPVIGGESDVIISAATAGGKTEAAWLPIISALAFERDQQTAEVGIKALYISPLKALINDQADRLRDVAAMVELPVYRRHGDVSGADRTKMLREPDGILLITPESLEALFVHQGTRIPSLFAGLRYAVIDELHSFIGTERGAQLQSLLHRIELALRRHVPRIALSATLADPRAAAEFLRPEHGGDVAIVGGADDDTTEIRLQLRGYIKKEVKGPLDRGPQGIYATIADRAAAEAVLDAPPPPDDLPATVDEEDDDETVTIVEHLFKTLRGRDNLVFANARGVVEKYADRLKWLSSRERVPNEFFPHHGSLSKELREDVERMLKATDVSATAICTSTLEMGIDIGSADAIAQLGAPNSVSALRQRLGRSGRRGTTPATLRVYVTEDALTAQTNPVDQLRAETFQSVAVIELLLEKWYEPPNLDGLHLSTLIQQILSVIAQHGGATALQLYSALCENGPFVHVTQKMFIQLLRDLAANDLLSQSSEGLLLHGGLGEKIANHYSFYTAFQTPEEYRLVANGHELGTLPIEYPLIVGQLIVFAGRRWRIVEIDNEAKVIELSRSTGGEPPSFPGARAAIADGVRLRMRELYESAHVPLYLDKNAQQLLSEGRAAYRHLNLQQEAVWNWGGDSLIFPWRGDRIMNTLMILLAQAGMNVSSEGIAIACKDASAQHVRRVLRQMAGSPMPDPIELASHVAVKEKEKFDGFLGDDLLTAGYAARDLDLPNTWKTLRDLDFRT
jgi:ATP-dependent Lhr-like helicase